jgi:transcriptional regulator with XRE-family HTH domain
VVLPQVAVNIRAAREAAGLTQEGLARQLDIALRTVSSWEAAERLPRGRNLQALARALARDPSWFYAEHEPRRPVAA